MIYLIRLGNLSCRCDVCGHACTQVLYEFRCYPKLDNLTEQDLWLTGKCIFLVGVSIKS